MAQDRMKIKKKPDREVKGSKKKRNREVERKKNASGKIQKKHSNDKAQQLKNMMTKEINKQLEEELRNRAMEGREILGKKKKKKDEN